MEKDSEINFVTVFWTVWSQKYLVLAIALLFGALAAFYALTATPMFEAQIVVTEASDSGIGGAAGLMNQLGGIASLAGLNLNSNGPNAERPAFLASRGLSAEFVNKYNLVPVLNVNAKVKSVWYAVQRFRKTVIDIHEEKVKGTTTITVDWRDPLVAARWANDYVALANDMMRERAQQEASRNIEYLSKQLAQTNVVEVQQASYRLIEAETKSLMLAHGRVEYAFTIVDPAVAPEMRSSPRRTLIVMTGIFVGGFMGSLIAVARNAIRRRLNPATH
jgi:uncharacterized protein involved in exopolysaccharide biosynthesis